MIKRIFQFVLIIIFGIVVYGCSGKTPVDQTVPISDETGTVKVESMSESTEPKSEMTVFQLFPSKYKVQDFLDKLTELPEFYEDDECYNVTPEEIYTKYGFLVFKFDKSCAGYVMVGDVIYPIQWWFGGCGLTSLAIADMNNDGQIELYYIASWGSGIHRSQVGYFDFATKKMVAFVFENYDNDMMFSIEDDKLILYNATISSTSFVDIKTEKTNAVGEIAFEKEQIVLIEYSENTASGKMESSSISANETSST